MRHFQFSMEKILEIRRFEQHEAELALGAANAAVSRIQEKLDAIAQQRVAVTRQTDESDDMAFYAHAQQYFLFLNQREELFLRDMAKARLVVEERSAAVRKAMQNVKVLEKFRESKFNEWKKSRLKEEEQLLDDVVTYRAKKMA
ncbi:MAG: flagellar export protein FliJ [Treponema sp.]|nr:flagellar export protein FliJ [Treponema sp.]